MSHIAKKGRLGRSLILAGLVLGSSVVASAAFAGECPADQKKPNATAPVDYKPVGVTDTVIAMIDVEKEPANIKDRKFRMRKLTVEPRRHRSLAQPRRSARDYLHHRRRDQ
jgi:hypothetical protein